MHAQKRNSEGVELALDNVFTGPRSKPEASINEGRGFD